MGMLPAFQAGYQTTLPPAASPRRRTTVAPDSPPLGALFLPSCGLVLHEDSNLHLLRRALQSTFPELTACTSSSQHGYSHLCPASKSSLYSLDMRIVRIKYVHTYIYIYVCVLQLKAFTKSPCVEM